MGGKCEFYVLLSVLDRGRGHHRRLGRGHRLQLRLRRSPHQAKDEGIVPHAAGESLGHF